jgi:hypothetical protein
MFPVVNCCLLHVQLCLNFAWYAYKSRETRGFSLRNYRRTTLNLFVVSFFPTVEVCFQCLLCRTVAGENRLAVSPAILCDDPSFLPIRTLAMSILVCVFATQMGFFSNFFKVWTRGGFDEAVVQKVVVWHQLREVMKRAHQSHPLDSKQEELRPCFVFVLIPNDQSWPEDWPRGQAQQSTVRSKKGYMKKLLAALSEKNDQRIRKAAADVSSHLSLKVERAALVPQVGARKLLLFVTVEIEGVKMSTRTVKHDANPVWKQRLKFHPVKLNDSVLIQLWNGKSKKARLVGSVSPTVRELIERPVDGLQIEYDAKFVQTRKRSTRESYQEESVSKENLSEDDVLDDIEDLDGLLDVLKTRFLGATDEEKDPFLIKKLEDIRSARNLAGSKVPWVPSGFSGQTFQQAARTYHHGEPLLVGGHLLR